MEALDEDGDLDDEDDDEDDDDDDDVAAPVVEGRVCGSGRSARIWSDISSKHSDQKSL